MHHVPLLAFALSTVAVAQTSPAFDAESLARCFAEVRLAAEEDGGRLWGIPLAGPLLVVDPTTRVVFANQADAEGHLQPEASVFTGTVEASLPLANTALVWRGTHWAMLLWPLPDSLVARRQVMLHELWHRVQDDLNLKASDPANDHLTQLDARVALHLEWRALAQALTTDQPGERAAPIRDALTFRAHRRAQLAGSAARERALEMHEGLAEYTGVRLRGTADAETRAMCAAMLRTRRSPAALPRGFAYRSGPALGLLLDDAAAGWRRSLRASDDLGELLRQALDLELPHDLAQAAADAADRYDGAEVLAVEQTCEQELAAQCAALRARLVDGPVLELSLTEPKISFDPNQVVSLDGSGQVHLGRVHLTDRWGTLVAQTGVLVSWPKMRAWVARGEDGWTLDLDGAFEVVPGVRDGDECVRVKP